MLIHSSGKFFAALVTIRYFPSLMNNDVYNLGHLSSVLTHVVEKRDIFSHSILQISARTRYIFLH